MIEGQKYHVITNRIPGVWNKPREFLMPFAGYGPGEGKHQMIFFNGTPAGVGSNQSIERGWIARASIANHDAKCFPPRIYRGP